MISFRWLLRAKQWAKNPPSEDKVKFVFAIIGLCLLLAGYDYFFGWPEALTPNGDARGRVRFPTQ